MNIVLSILIPILNSLHAQNDAGGPGLILFGLGALLVIFVVITLIVIIIVQILKYFRNRNHDDTNTKE
jgi:uncharacterized membrane protein